MSAPWFGADQALSALEAALASSRADQVEISATSRVGHHTRFAGDRIHQAQSIVECQVLVRAVVGTGSARVAVNSLAHAPRAVARGDSPRARARRRGRRASRPTTSPVTRSSSTTPACGVRRRRRGTSPRARTWPAPSWTRRVAPGARVNGTLTSALTELAVVTSRGVRAYGAATEAGFTMTIRFQRRLVLHRRPRRRDASALDVEAARSRRSRRPRACARSSRSPTASHDVVFGPLAAGELIGFVPDFGFRAPARRAGIGLVAQRRGALVAAPEVTIADDARADVGLPFPFDFEGTAKRRVALVEQRPRRRGGERPRQRVGHRRGVSTGHASIGREQSPEPACANLVMDAGHPERRRADRGCRARALRPAALVQPARRRRERHRRGHEPRRVLPHRGRRAHDGAWPAGASTRVSSTRSRARTALGSVRYSQPIPNLWNSCITAPAMRVRGFRFGARTRKEESE